MEMIRNGQRYSDSEAGIAATIIKPSAPWAWAESHSRDAAKSHEEGPFPIFQNTLRVLGMEEYFRGGTGFDESPHPIRSVSRETPENGIRRIVDILWMK